MIQQVPTKRNNIIIPNINDRNLSKTTIKQKKKNTLGEKKNKLLMKKKIVLR